MKILIYPFQENFNLFLVLFGVWTITLSLVGVIQEYQNQAEVFFFFQDFLLTFSYTVFFYSIFLYIINLLISLSLYVD